MDNIGKETKPEKETRKARYSDGVRSTIILQHHQHPGDGIVKKMGK